MVQFASLICQMLVEHPLLSNVSLAIAALGLALGAVLGSRTAFMGIIEMLFYKTVVFQ